MREKPPAAEYADYFARYVSLITEPDVLPVLERQIGEVNAFAAAVGSEREMYRYAPGKWSIRQVFGHMIDVERVFAYRALCISRGESSSLPSFDENKYVEHSPYDAIPLEDLRTEFADLRKANLHFLRRLDDAAWRAMGTSSSKPVSVRALAYVMAGHVRHHFNGLLQNYKLLPKI
ncbi:MAG TPA: DinB family protein [Bacteroidota bacterium]|nr:DinB family protein [Bacteroidota bacterium]